MSLAPGGRECCGTERRVGTDGVPDRVLCLLERSHWMAWGGGGRWRRVVG